MKERIAGRCWMREEKKSYERRKREKDFSKYEAPLSSLPSSAYCFRLTSSYFSIELLGNSRERNVAKNVDGRGGADGVETGSVREE